MNFLKIFQPAPHIARLPDAEIKTQYPYYRRTILQSTFLGYATFYLLRNNLPVISKEMGEVLHYDKSQIGDFLAITAITYGIGKLLMGALSDRSNPRYFMATGLIMSALCNFVFGFFPGYHVHLFLWGLNGLIQGMGWAPCGRSIGHWFSVGERGTMFSFWNIAHNVGQGLIGIIAAYATSLFGWQYAFIYPGIIALRMAVYLLITMRDTPQSVGLPPVEEFRNDYPAEEVEHSEKELTTKELFMNYILFNKYLWIFAVANFFVYIVRYSLLDWGPTYLKEVKHASIEEGGGSTFVYEFAGIGSTILMGWLSDRLGGRRGMVSFLCMIPIFLAFIGIIFTPPGMLWLDMTLFAIIGFFVYPPVMLLGVSGLDFTSKKAVGTAAGFIGLFGYAGRTVQGKFLGTIAQDHGWDTAMYAILVAVLLSLAALSVTWKLKPRG